MFHLDIGIPTASSYDDDGFLSVQYDAEGEQNAGVAGYECHHFLGSMARPLDPVVDSTGQPDATNAGQMLIAMEGGKGHAFMLQDVRIVPKLPALKPGEKIDYGCSGAFTRYRADGSIVQFTTDQGGDPAGRSIYQSVGAKAADGSLEFCRIGPWGQEHWGKNGYRLLHESGVRISAGTIGGLPDPLSAIASSYRVQAGVIRLDAGVVMLGPQGASAEPAAKATTLLEYMALQQAKIKIYDAFFLAISTSTTAAQIASAALTATNALALIDTTVPPDILSSVMVG